MQSKYLLSLSLISGLSLFSQAQTGQPNIIFIMADDMGLGDVSSINKEAKWQTPNIDKLTNHGVYFTDAHSSSAVCTPTRYGLLNGRYNWRSELKSGVHGGFNKPTLMDKERLTVADLLKSRGYNTGIVGKWHLGVGWHSTTGNDVKGGRYFKDIDFKKKLYESPLDHGFDYYYGHPVANPAWIMIENDQCVAVSHKIIKAKPPKETGVYDLPVTQDDDAIRMLSDKAVDYINQQSKNKPFFLYYPLSAPHTPIAPSKNFVGASKFSKYGDFCIEVDWAVGQVLNALEKKDLTENTIIIFTADNGSSPAAKVYNMEKKGQFSSLHFRGYKADVYEGGHRVPFLVRWPKVIKAARKSDKLISLNDFMATVAELTNYQLPVDAGEDSFSFLGELTGQAPTTEQRDNIVNHSIQGKFAVREGDWKLIFDKASGGWSDKQIKKKMSKKEWNNLPKWQLYNLKNDPAEKQNLIAKYPEKVAELKELMTKLLKNGRSTTGPRQANDHPVKETGKGKVPGWPGLGWLDNTNGIY
ncbi:arylsulfatase [Lentisphaerota bacterium WC36G]|nr:arylsulfatase [Lentisphaerae bacterium WC36]